MTSVTLRWTRETVERLLNDPGLSDWARLAVIDLARRDPLDALQDCELLTALMQDRFDTVVRNAGTPDETSYPRCDDIPANAVNIPGEDL